MEEEKEVKEETTEEPVEEQSSDEPQEVTVPANEPEPAPDLLALIRGLEERVSQLEGASVASQHEPEPEPEQEPTPDESDNDEDESGVDDVLKAIMD